MTQEDKLLLLKDLSARVPYGVKIEGYKLLCIILDSDWLHFMYTHQEFAIRRPYLRPMSSMTKDEVKEFQSISNFKCYPKHIKGAFFDNDYTPFSTFDSGSKFCRITMSNVISCIDWLLKKHFDFRDLIEKGLAIEAPEGMYDLKEE